MLPDRSISVDCKTKHKNRLPPLSPISRLSPDNLFPPWLLKRSDFKRSLEEKVFIENFNFRTEPAFSHLNTKIIKKQLQKCEFINNLGKTRLNDLVQLTEIIKFLPQENLKQGYVYLLLFGKLILKQEVLIYANNIIDRELSLYPDQIIPKCEVGCLKIPAESFNKAAYYTKLQQIKSISRVLAGLKVFSDLKIGQFSLLSNKALILFYPQHSIVYSIGDSSNFFYVLVEGECELSSLVTIKTSNFIPSTKNNREKVKFESKFTKVKTKIEPCQVFGMAEVVNCKERQSQVRVVSQGAKIVVINWRECEEIFKPSQLERIRQEFRVDSSQEFTRQVTEDMKKFKKKFKALLAASCIKQNPTGREVFENLPKRKKLYLQALENSHKAQLNDLNFNSKGRNISLIID